jgi:hypothetical protein
MLTSCSREAVRPFKSVRSFDSHLPILSRARSGTNPWHHRKEIDGSKVMMFHAKPPRFSMMR